MEKPTGGPERRFMDVEREKRMQRMQRIELDGGR